MKIVIYTWSLSNGGAERVASLWAQGFAKERQNSVCVMLGSFCSRNDYVLPPNITIKRQSIMYNVWKCIFPNFFSKRFFASRYCDYVYNALPEILKNWFTSRIIKEVSPDVIIVVLPGFLKRIQGALKIGKLNIPVIVTDHNVYERPDYAPLSKTQQKLKFIDSVNYDFLTVLTEADKRVLEKRMDKDFLKKVFVLPNPLTYKPLERVPEKEKVILAAGRMEIWHCKGFDLLLKAWAMVQGDFPDWKLKIAGGGDNQPLLKICIDLGISNRVEFLGFVDLKKEYEKAEVFVLSSRYEGFGMVLTEAMSQGCACIACDYKGRQREIISDDSQGIVCQTDDENAIADALRKVVSDDEYRHMLQKNAIERSKYYELPNIMKCWNIIFEKIGLKK